MQRLSATEGCYRRCTDARRLCSGRAEVAVLPRLGPVLPPLQVAVQLDSMRLVRRVDDGRCFPDLPDIRWVRRACRPWVAVAWPSKVISLPFATLQMESERESGSPFRSRLSFSWVLCFSAFHPFDQSINQSIASFRSLVTHTVHTYGATRPRYISAHIIISRPTSLPDIGRGLTSALSWGRRCHYFPTATYISR